MVKPSADIDFGDYKNDSLERPRDKAWTNWAKFENEGDKVSGYVRDVFYRGEEDGFKPQRGITLEQPNGELINVGIKRMAFILSKTNNLRIGDPLTIEYEKTLAPRQKGYKGMKVFGFYGKNLEENASNKTVYELEKEDMELQKAAPNEDEEEKDDEIAFD